MPMKLTLTSYILVLFYLVRYLTAGLKCYECTIVEQQAGQTRQQPSDFCVEPKSGTRVKNCNSGEMCGEKYWDFNFTQDNNVYQYGGLERNCVARISGVNSPGCKKYDQAEAENFVTPKLPPPSSGTGGGISTTIAPSSSAAPSPVPSPFDGTRGAAKLVEAYVKECQCGTDLCNKETYFYSAVVFNNSYGQQVRPFSSRGFLCAFLMNWFLPLFQT